MGVRVKDIIKYSVVLTPLLFSMNNEGHFGVSVLVLFLSAISFFYIRDFSLLIAAVTSSYVITGMSAISTGAMVLFLLFIHGCRTVSIIDHEKIDIYSSLCLLILISLVSLLFEMSGLSFFNASVEPGGFLGNAPTLCLLISVSIPFFVRKNLVVAVLLSVLSLAIGEVTGLISLIVSVALYGFLIEAYILSALLLFAGFGHIKQSFSIRIDIWSKTILQIARQPLFGYGPGIFEHVSDQFIKGYYKADTAFSSILQSVFNCGSIIIVPILVLFRRIWNIKDCPERSAIIVLFVLSLFEYPVEVVKLWPLYIIIIGNLMKKEFVNVR